MPTDTNSLSPATAAYGSAARTAATRHASPATPAYPGARVEHAHKYAHLWKALSITSAYSKAMIRERPALELADDDLGIDRPAAPSDRAVMCWFLDMTAGQGH
jgi:hypothetical protein